LCHVTLNLAETSVVKSRPSDPHLANLCTFRVHGVIVGIFLWTVRHQLVSCGEYNQQAIDQSKNNSL